MYSRGVVTAYLNRHNAAFKILFFELLRDHGLVKTVPPWYSPTQPKPIYEGEDVTAYWDAPVFADQTEVKANRIDGRIVNKESKTEILLEISCPWVENGDQKDRRPGSTPHYVLSSRDSTLVSQSGSIISSSMS